MTAPPILVLGQRQGPNRFAGYLREILATEGIAPWEYRDLSEEPAGLAGRGLVILENATVPEAWRARIESWVREGGRLIASRPPLEMAGLFGLKPTKSIVKTCAELCVTFDPQHPLASGLGAESLQFHGTADLYEPVGAQGVAWLGGQLGVRTGYPAVTLHAAGKGRAAAFTFDLALATVLFHQGRRLHASDGPDPDPNADGAYKPDDLFYRFLDERLKHIPQADLYGDLLVRLIRHLSPVPMPRLWHYPDAAPAVALLDGDSDDMTAEDIEKVFALAESAGGKFTIYLMPEHYGTLAPERMAEFRARGHDAGPHPFAGRMPTGAESARQIARETEDFRERYGFQPLAQRGHNVIWLGWVAHARELLRNGIRLDTNFYCGAGLQYGYLNGSGLPVRFVDEAGEIMDVYEQATVSMEDGWYTEKSLMPAMTVAECAAQSLRQIDDAVDRWHAVYHPCFHPVYVRPGPKDSTPWIRAVVEHLAKRGVPFVNGSEWVAFNEARRALDFTELAWNEARGELRLGVRARQGAKGLTLLLPATVHGRRTSGHPSCRAVRREGLEQLAWVLNLQPGAEEHITLVYS